MQGLYIFKDLPLFVKMCKFNKQADICSLQKREYALPKNVFLLIGDVFILYCL